MAAVTAARSACVLSSGVVHGSDQISSITGPVEGADPVLANRLRQLTDVGGDDRNADSDGVKELVRQRQAVIEPPVRVRHEGQPGVGEQAVHAVERRRRQDVGLPGVELGQPGGICGANQGHREAQLAARGRDHLEFPIRGEPAGIDRPDRFGGWQAVLRTWFEGVPDDVHVPPSVSPPQSFGNAFAHRQHGGRLPPEFLLQSPFALDADRGRPTDPWAAAPELVRVVHEFRVRDPRPTPPRAPTY